MKTNFPFLGKKIYKTALVLLVLFTCSKNPVNHNSEIEITVGEWKTLGFEDKFALRLVLAEPYLYVCAGSDGLWRMDIRNMTSWEYLGLADSTLCNYANIGVLEVDVDEQDILVAYNGSAPHIKPEASVGIWRSINGGRNWFRSDCGIPETINFQYEYNFITSLQRSPHNREIVLSCAESVIYRSTDNGYMWKLIAGRRGVILNGGNVRWHPYRPGELWFFGETALFAPYLGCAQDYGLRGKVGVDFIALGFPNDGAVYDIAFDVDNPDIIYAATSEGLIKSTDGGYSWQVSGFQIPEGGFIFRMIDDPRKSNRLFLAGGRHVYYSSDGAKTIRILKELNWGYIQSIALDLTGNQLIVGTTRGVFALPIKCE